MSGAFTELLLVLEPLDEPPELPPEDGRDDGTAYINAFPLLSNAAQKVVEVQDTELIAVWSSISTGAVQVVPLYVSALPL